MVPALFLGQRPNDVAVPALFLGQRPNSVVVPALFLGEQLSVVMVPALFLGEQPSVVMVPALFLEKQPGAHHPIQPAQRDGDRRPAAAAGQAHPSRSGTDLLANCRDDLIRLRDDAVRLVRLRDQLQAILWVLDARQVDLDVDP
jgi:hypothetical protein